RAPRRPQLVVVVARVPRSPSRRCAPRHEAGAGGAADLARLAARGANPDRPRAGLVRGAGPRTMGGRAPRLGSSPGRARLLVGAANHAVAGSIGRSPREASGNANESFHEP